MALFFIIWRPFCRYVARPPVATERLSTLPDGRLLYRLRHHWRDGTTHVLFEPLELVGKLAALVPPPRFNLVRYNGILAPAARWRSHVVPFDPEVSSSVHHTGCGGRKQPENPDRKDSQKPRRCHPRNYTWAELMKRVFDQSTNCMPRPRNNYTRPSHAPLSSPVGTGARLC
jgi:hypothetical protein